MTDDLDLERVDGITGGELSAAEPEHARNQDRNDKDDSRRLDWNAVAIALCPQDTQRCQHKRADVNIVGRFCANSDAACQTADGEPQKGCVVAGRRSERVVAAEKQCHSGHEESAPGQIDVSAKCLECDDGYAEQYQNSGAGRACACTQCASDAVGCASKKKSRQ